MLCAFAFQSTNCIDILNPVNLKIFLVAKIVHWLMEEWSKEHTDAGLTFPLAMPVVDHDAKNTWLEKAWQSHVQIQMFFKKTFEIFINIFKKMFSFLTAGEWCHTGTQC